MLEDLNRMIAAVEDIAAIADQETAQAVRSSRAGRERLEGGLERIYRLKKAAYEDFREGLISRRDFLRYQEDYERQEREAAAQLEQLSGNGEDGGRPPWVDDLIRQGKLTALAPWASAGWCPPRSAA